MCCARTKWGDAGFFLAWAVQGLPLRERFSLVLQVILELQDVPGTRNRTLNFALGGYTLEALDTPEFREFLGKLALAGNPEVRAVGADLKARLVALEKKKPTPPKPAATGASPPIQTGQGVAFKRLKLVWTDGGPHEALVWGFKGCLPIGANLDVVWGSHGLGLMREKGRLKRLWPLDGPYRVNGVCFDGRYVWATADFRQQGVKLLVLDPVSEKIREITAKDGLPLLSPEEGPGPFRPQYLVAAPLEPGKVCVAGAFGHTWLAMVTFDPTVGPTVKMCHEARTVADPEKKEQWKDPSVAFTPTFIFTLEGKKGPKGRSARRVLVGRSSRHVDLTEHPLLFDPDNLRAEIMVDSLWGETNPGRMDVDDGALYLIGPPYPVQRLYRFAPPEMVKVSILQDFPEGSLLVSAGRAQILGEHWWEGDLAKNEVRLLASTVPWQHGYNFQSSRVEQFRKENPKQAYRVGPDEKRLVAHAHSAHYGTLVCVFSATQGMEIYQVLFPEK